MNTLKLTLASIAVISMLGASPAILANDNNDKSFEDVIVMEKFPDEVQSGSIRIKDDDDQTMARLSSISSSEAAAIAIQAFPGKVIETRLDNENGFLIWEVEVITPNGRESELKIDAGNGHLLAIETDEDEDDEDHKDKNENEHSNWKFWEDNDKDEDQEHD